MAAEWFPNRYLSLSVVEWLIRRRLTQPPTKSRELTRHQDQAEKQRYRDDGDGGHGPPFQWSMRLWSGVKPWSTPQRTA